MSDFEAIAAVRTKLLKDSDIERIFLTIPPKAVTPYVHVELDESWSLLAYGGVRLVKFVVSIYSQSINHEEILRLGDDIRSVLEGAKLSFGDSAQGAVKSINAMMEKWQPGQPHLMRQFYSALIRE